MKTVEKKAVVILVMAIIAATVFLNNDQAQKSFHPLQENELFGKDN